MNTRDAVGPTPAFLPLKKIAATLALSELSVRRLVERGELPIHRFGRTIRVRQDDLDAYVDRCRHDTGPASKPRPERRKPLT